MSTFTVKLRVLTQEEIQAEYVREHPQKEMEKRQNVPASISENNLANVAPTAVSQNSDENRGDEEMSGNENPLAGVLNTSNSNSQEGDDKRNPAAPMIVDPSENEAHEVDPTDDTNHEKPCCIEAKQKVNNIVISVKNNDNLDEFSSKTYIASEYIPKLQKWIEKNKYVCEETIDDMQLNVQIFNFKLQKTQKTEAEVLKDEMTEIKSENISLMRDMKLFQHYFFNFWKDRCRESLLERPYLLENIVESPQNLYNICEGLGFVEVEQYNGKHTFYIGFRQPVPFLYHTGNTRNEEMQMQSKRNGRFQNYGGQQAPQAEDWFEVFMSGKGFPHNLASISSKAVKQVILGPDGQIVKTSHALQHQSMVVGVDQQMLYLHKVDLNVVKGATYTIYTPKLFA